MLFDFKNLVFKNFWLEVATKRSLSRRAPAIAPIQISGSKGMYFFDDNFLCPMLLHIENLVCREE